MSLDKIKLIETKLESYNALLKVAIFEKEKTISILNFLGMLQLFEVEKLKLGFNASNYIKNNYKNYYNNFSSKTMQVLFYWTTVFPLPTVSHSQALTLNSHHSTLQSFISLLIGQMSDEFRLVICYSVYLHYNQLIIQSL